MTVRIARLLALAGICLALLAGPASAGHCAPRAEMVKMLTEKYKEVPRGLGVIGQGLAAMEVYTSADGTWTIVQTRVVGADRRTCIIAAGHSWSLVPQNFDPES